MNIPSEYTDQQHMRNLTFLTIGFGLFVVVVLVASNLYYKVQTFQTCLLDGSVMTCLGQLDGTQ